ncbi:MAG: hypothetical protein IJU72_02385 [Bacteroidales bacterium]|nr:hypothetical protein [Bacteroidales bacterium]
MAVLILSDSTDLTTCQVIDWLRVLGHDFVRMGISELHTKCQLTIDFTGKSVLYHKGQRIGSIWFRRNDDDASVLRTIKSNIIRKLARRKIEETRTVNSILDYGDIFWLSHPRSESINKLRVIQRANALHIRIPPTIVTNTKRDLISFIAQHDIVISKAVSENLSITDIGSRQLYRQAVVLLDSNNTQSIPNKFHSSMFQKFIHKQYDVRIFFLDGKIYSMAIFSHSHDYREAYSSNRNVPYTLPNEEQNKVAILMRDLGLNIGCIDMIMGTDGQLYLLEVNPNGQFGDMSLDCNYHLER